MSRRAATGRTSDTFLVVTNGEVTETQYFEKAFPANLTLRMRKGKHPSDVVRNAIELGKSQKSDAPYTKIWVVVDLDNYEKDLLECERLIRKNPKLNIELVVSVPCFEVWLLWHFQDYFSPGTCQDAQEKWSKCRQEMSTSTKKIRRNRQRQKHIPDNFPYEKWKDAAQRHKRAIKQNAGKEYPNPSAPLGNIWSEVNR